MADKEVETTDTTVEDSGKDEMDILREIEAANVPEDETPEESESSDDEPDLKATPRYKRSFEALKRIPGIDDGLLDGMDPQKLIDWGKQVAEQQKENDTYGNRLKEAETEAAKLKSQLKDAEPAKSSDSEPASPDFTEALKPFTEIYGEEASSPIIKALTDLAKNQAAGRSAEAEQLQTRLAELEDGNRTLIREMRRDTLRERFPQIKDDENWAEVTEKAKGMADAGWDYSEALEDAARILFFDDINAERTKLKKGVSSAKKHGTSEHSERRATEEEPAVLTGDDAQMEALRLLEKENMSPTEINKRFHSKK